MEKIKQFIVGVAVICSGMFCFSCNDYLGILPKGEKIPTTYADYEAFIRNETYHICDATQAINLLNDVYMSPDGLNAMSLESINYNWMEDENRILYNVTDETPYYRGYQAIFAWNMVLQNADAMTECTEMEREELRAQAKVLRAMNYFILANYYADAYEEETAAEKLSVPLITSPDMNAPFEQVTIASMYDFLLTELMSAVPYLQERPATVLHPNKGAGYAMLARVYLAMENYEKALVYADSALMQNSALYDWRQYYEENRELIEKPDDWSTTYPSVVLDNVENYVFRYGTYVQRNYGLSGTTGAIPVLRAELFENGDAYFASHWKKRYISPDTLYYGITNDKFNGGGITTPEMYFIKAECLARQGGQTNIDEAMDLMNAVREMRIFADVYQPLTAFSVQEAVKLIVKTKANVYVQTPIPFWDARRLNLHPEYAETRTKVYDGRTLTLSSTSHLWTMPFPGEVIQNPGNGTLQQNVEK